MNRFIAIGLILTFAVGELQAQQPTPARRPSSPQPTTRTTNPAASQPSRRSEPTPSSQTASKQPVQRAVAVKTEPASNVGTSARPARKSEVTQASAAQYGEVVYDEHAPMGMSEGPVYYDEPGVSGCDSCGSGSCGGSCGMTFGSCGLDICNPPAGARQLCICLPSHGWVQLDYLGWYPSGMNVPPLATTSTSQTVGQGILGEATTRHLIGNQILTDRFDGGRIRFGWWFANNPSLGLELEYLGTGTQDYSFSQRSAGDPLLARPFFNVLTGLQDSQLVAQTGVVTGKLDVNASSEFQGGAIRFRKSLCCGSNCKFSCLSCGPVQSQSRIDATLGFRTFELNDNLTIREDLQSQRNAGDAFLIEDSFRTRNQFNGAELGVMWQGRRGYWTLDMLLRTSFGNTRQEVMIDGSTETTELINGVSTTTEQEGGLFAQSTNIGSYVRQQFGVVPEVGATLGYQLTPRMRLTAGYTFIYWSNVARPGDQIDTDVNTNLLPPAVDPITGALRPRSPLQNGYVTSQKGFRTTDYFIQGVNLGAEYRW